MGIKNFLFSLFHSETKKVYRPRKKTNRRTFKEKRLDDMKAETALRKEEQKQREMDLQEREFKLREMKLEAEEMKYRRLKKEEEKTIQELDEIEEEEPEQQIQVIQQDNKWDKIAEVVANVAPLFVNQRSSGETRQDRADTSETSRKLKDLVGKG